MCTCCHVCQLSAPPEEWHSHISFMKLLNLIWCFQLQHPHHCIVLWFITPPYLTPADNQSLWNSLSTWICATAVSCEKLIWEFGCCRCMWWAEQNHRCAVGCIWSKHTDAEMYMHTLIFLSSNSITKVKVRVSFVMGTDLSSCTTIMQEGMKYSAHFVWNYIHSGPPKQGGPGSVSARQLVLWNFFLTFHLGFPLLWSFYLLDFNLTLFFMLFLKCHVSCAIQAEFPCDFLTARTILVEHVGVAAATTNEHLISALQNIGAVLESSWFCQWVKERNVAW